MISWPAGRKWRERSVLGMINNAECNNISGRGTGNGLRPIVFWFMFLSHMVRWWSRGMVEWLETKNTLPPWWPSDFTSILGQVGVGQDQWASLWEISYQDFLPDTRNFGLIRTGLVVLTSFLMFYSFNYRLAEWRDLINWISRYLELPAGVLLSPVRHNCIEIIKENMQTCMPGSLTSLVSYQSPGSNAGLWLVGLLAISQHLLQVMLSEFDIFLVVATRLCFTS